MKSDQLLFLLATFFWEKSKFYFYFVLIKDLVNQYI